MRRIAAIGAVARVLALAHRQDEPPLRVDDGEVRAGGGQQALQHIQARCDRAALDPAHSGRMTRRPAWPSRAGSDRPAAGRRRIRPAAEYGPIRGWSLVIASSGRRQSSRMLSSVARRARIAQLTRATGCGQPHPVDNARSRSVIRRQRYGAASRIRRLPSSAGCCVERSRAKAREQHPGARGARSHSVTAQRRRRAASTAQ